MAPFSNTGLNDYYNPVTGQTIPQVRAGVDIVAPGDDLTLAYYGGLTGGHVSGTDPTGGEGYWYAYEMAGTSFAAPIVAGGAALLVDYGYANFGGGTSIDGRIIKAVLLNSATKLPGWNNAQTLVNGVITTTQGLDPSQGAGMLNLAQAYTQYSGGTHNLPGLGGGSVAPIGWDFGAVGVGAANDYYITSRVAAGSPITATLSWFVNTTYDDSNLTATNNELYAADLQFSNLDLQVWSVVNGKPVSLIADCDSLYNNLNPLYFDAPQTGYYMIRVNRLADYYNFFLGGSPTTDYGLAWAAVAEPATLILLLPAAALFIIWRRKA